MDVHTRNGILAQREVMSSSVELEQVTEDLPCPQVSAPVRPRTTVDDLLTLVHQRPSHLQQLRSAQHGAPVLHRARLVREAGYLEELHCVRWCSCAREALCVQLDRTCSKYAWSEGRRKVTACGDLEALEEFALECLVLSVPEVAAAETPVVTSRAWVPDWSQRLPFGVLASESPSARHVSCGCHARRHIHRQTDLRHLESTAFALELHVLAIVLVLTRKRLFDGVELSQARQHCGKLRSVVPGRPYFAEHGRDILS